MNVATAYFQQVALDVFGQDLENLGSRITRAETLMVRFESDDWFVELIALSEDGPRYSPRVEIGPLPERGLLSRDKQVDILHTLPKDSPLRNYNLTLRYSNDIEMRDSFTQVRDKIFRPYAVAILLDHMSLCRLVDDRSKVINSEWKEEINSHNDAVFRSKANSAFAVKNYREYLAQIQKIPTQRCTKSEIARIKYAIKHIND